MAAQGQIFKGKFAVVTGASAGIGRETALKLAEAGAEVLAVARRMELLKELEKQSSNIRGLALDVSASLAPLDNYIAEKKIHILVNNAGLSVGRNELIETSDEAIRTMFDTNVLGLIRMTKKILPKMLVSGGGDIVNLGSIAGYQTYPNGAVYCATKYAVRALTESLQQECLGKGIRVMGIHPGMVETEFSIVRYGGDREKASKVYEGMNPLTASDIADAIVWMLSRPRHVNIAAMTIFPSDQAGVGHVHRRKLKGNS